jgi:hypothetical protein
MEYDHRGISCKPGWAHWTILLRSSPCSRKSNWIPNKPFWYVIMVPAFAVSPREWRSATATTAAAALHSGGNEMGKMIYETGVLSIKRFRRSLCHRHQYLLVLLCAVVVFRVRNVFGTNPNPSSLLRLYLFCIDKRHGASVFTFFVIKWHSMRFGLNLSFEFEDHLIGNRAIDRDESAR